MTHKNWKDEHWLQSLLEADDDAPAPTDNPNIGKAPDIQLPNDSVDAVIDEQLTQATKAVNSSGGQTTENKKFSLKLLLEADGVSPQPGQGKPLDSAAMCREVARIVQNASGLIDLEGTVLRRSLNYIAKTYGPDAMKQVQTMLERNYSISTQSQEDRDDDRQDINAAGAGPEIG